MPAETTFQVNTPASVAAAAAARSASSSNTRSPAASNATAFASNSQSLSTAPQISPDTQNLLNRVGASSSISSLQGTPEWEAARQSLLKSMAGGDSVFSSSTKVPVNRSPLHHQLAGAPQSTSSPRNETITMASTLSRPPPNPSVRGRGGSSRGSRGSISGRGRPRAPGRRKRKRRDSDEESVGEAGEDDDDSDVSNSYTPLPSTTRSGRNVTKPQAFVPPAPAESSTTSTPARGGGRATNGSMSSRRGLPKQYSNVNPSRARSNTGFSPDTIVCSRCLRAHSPPANPIVFCDGCDTSYHQWCHLPPISREVVLLPDKEWFCGDCDQRREMIKTPNETRVPASAEGLTEEEQETYLNGVPHKTLVTLLLAECKRYPGMNLFAPNTRHLVQTVLNPLSLGQRGGSKVNDQSEQDDKYSEWNNPHGDPPATYNRPGQGQLPRINVAKEPWLVDNDSVAFSHLVADGPNGELVKLDRSKGNWIRFHEPGSGFGLHDRPDSQSLDGLINGIADTHGPNGKNADAQKPGNPAQPLDEVVDMSADAFAGATVAGAHEASNADIVGDGEQRDAVGTNSDGQAADGSRNIVQQMHEDVNADSSELSYDESRDQEVEPSNVP